MRKKNNKVFYISQKQAEAKTGYFKISSLMISIRLSRKIEEYLRKNDLRTWLGHNQARTSWNHHTLNFTLKIYSNIDSPKAYLSKPGALGQYKTVYRKKLKDLQKRSPSLEDMYFWICRKYPDEILWMDYEVVDPHEVYRGAYKPGRTIFGGREK